VFVVTVDQRGSREGPDLVDHLLASLGDRERWPAPLLPFERTTGDEVQGVLEGADVVVDLALALVRKDRWSVGVGVGPVREPLPASTRAGAGAAFTNARAAVERAKADPQRVAVVGPAGSRAGDAEAVLRLLAAVAQRRTDAGWEAIDLVADGATQQAAAARLGISKQAVSQRLHAALWPQERRVRPVAAALLAEVDDR
jgi:hypothetical protein